MNRFIPRFWCRVLCPLGAFLGVISRFALFGMEKDHAKCTDCNLCLVHCQGADSPQGGVKHRQDECHMCLNCETACPEDVIKFRFLPNRKSTVQKPDLGRRTAVATAAAGAVAIPAMRIANWPDKAYSEKVIRPPGAVEEREFLERCIRCAECMKVCPNNALHPAFFEAGVEGLWTPILIPRIGYCEFSCVLCGQVCPTGAIQKIDREAEDGRRAEADLGRHRLVRPRALPAVVDGDAVHRVRGVLPDVAQGHLGRRGRRSRSATASTARRASTPKMLMVDVQRPARRSVAVHRLRRVREGVPDRRQAGGLRDQRRRDALEDERHPPREHELRPDLRQAPRASISPRPVPGLF